MGAVFVALVVPEALRFRGSKGSTDSAGSGFINKWEILRVVDIFIRGFACCGVGKRLRPPEFGKWSLETLENLETNWILRELFLLGTVGGISFPNLRLRKEKKCVCKRGETL